MGAPETEDAKELSEVLDVLGSKGATGIGAVLDVVTEKVPALLTSLRSTLYSPQAGEEIGRGVGAFYKELVASGVPENDAIQMTRSYLSTLQEVLSSSMQSGHHTGHGGHQE